MKRSQTSYILERARDNHKIALRALARARKRLEAYDRALVLLEEDLGEALWRDREEAERRVESVEVEVMHWLLVSRGEKTGRRERKFLPRNL